jgi:hypothetical protein
VRNSFLPEERSWAEVRHPSPLTTGLVVVQDVDLATEDEEQAVSTFALLDHREAGREPADGDGVARQAHRRGLLGEQRERSHELQRPEVAGIEADQPPCQAIPQTQAPGWEHAGVDARGPVHSGGRHDGGATDRDVVGMPVGPVLPERDQHVGPQILEDQAQLGGEPLDTGRVWREAIEPSRIWPASPLVAETTLIRQPAALLFANVPPPQNTSSSGWAKTPRRWVAPPAMTAPWSSNLGRDG